METSESKPFDYASIAPGYYDDVFARGAGVQSAWHHLKFRHLRECMPSNYERHLDIGCGPGTFIGTLPAEKESLGIDVATSQIAYAREKYGTEKHQFACVDVLKDSAFEPESFDVVTIVEVIEHLPQETLEPLLGAACRALKPGGVLFATTPNYGSLWPLLEIAVNKLGEVSYEEQHISKFKRRSLRSLLQRSGFDAVKVRTFQGLAPFLAALSWSLAGAVQRIETPLLKRGMGFLLVAEARKGSESTR